MNHRYVSDSINNRTFQDDFKQSHSALNKLLKTAKSDYTYDSRGNRLSKTSSAQTTTYAYDAQDRLRTVTQGAIQTVYEYDAFNRRTAKVSYSFNGSEWIKTERTRFVYLLNTEVGSCESEGNLTELRIMGRSSGGGFGATVAIELHGEIYAPIHDHSGHACCLLDIGGNVAEIYRRGAFGEETVFDSQGGIVETPLNPWRYCGKRWDLETGLVFFGFRYYDPETATWITPDPLGHEGGPNLYAYVYNNPFVYCDLEGLFGLPSWKTTLNAINWCSDAYSVCSSMSSKCYETASSCCDMASSCYDTCTNAYYNGCLIASSICLPSDLFWPENNIESHP